MEKNIRNPILQPSIFIIIVAIIIGWIILSRIHGSKAEQNFYNQSFNTIVISSNSYHHRSIEFHLGNSLKLYFMPSDMKKVEIGDSIQKKRKTYFYDVYRRNANGEYKFWSTYNFEESL